MYRVSQCLIDWLIFLFIQLYDYRLIVWFDKENRSTWLVDFWFLKFTRCEFFAKKVFKSQWYQSINQSINRPFHCLISAVNIHMNGECRLIDRLIGEKKKPFQLREFWLFRLETNFHCAQDVERNILAQKFSKSVWGGGRVKIKIILWSFYGFFSPVFFSCSTIWKIPTEEWCLSRIRRTRRRRCFSSFCKRNRETSSKSRWPATKTWSANVSHVTCLRVFFRKNAWNFSYGVFFRSL